MAQKTLLSFFKKAPPVIASPQSSANNQESVKEKCISPESSANNKESVKDECINDSPIKQPNKRRRLNPIIDSDEEEPSDSNDIQKKDSSSSQASNEKSKSLEKEQVNGDANKMSNGVTIKEIEDKDKTQNVEFIPKRKTARKAMKGGLKDKASNSIENSSLPDTNPEPMDVSNTDSKSDNNDTPLDASNRMEEMEVDKSSNENEADEKKSPKEMTEDDSLSSKKGKEERSPKTVKKDKKVKEEVEEPVKNVKEEVEEPVKKVKEEVEEPVKKVKEEVEEPVKKVKEEVEKPVKKVKEEVEEPVKKLKKEVEIEKPAKNKKNKRTKSSGKKKIKKEAEDSGSDKNKSDSNESGLSEAESADEEDPKKNADSSSVKEKPAVHPFFASASKKVDSGSKGGSKATSSSSENSSSKEKSKINLSSSSGNVYNPSKSPYHPIDDACWKHGEKVPYLALAKTLELIESTSARLLMIEILSNFLRSVIVHTPDDLIYCVYLCLNRLAPEYEGIELGVGETLLMKAVAQATGRTVDKIKAEVAVKGDLGLVAESSRGHQRVMFAPPKLTVSSVFSKFKEIAKMSGNSAMAKKTDKIQALFVACRDCEAKYIIRTLSGKLRIGLAEQSVLAALARAAVMTPPNQTYPPEIMDKSAKMSADKFKQYLNEKALILKTTYCECPNYDLIIPVLLKEGIDALPEHCQLTPGCPLKPMLAQPTNGIAEVLNRFDKNEFTCEFKYDGERAQIHMTDKGEVKIFSRNQEDNTSKYPDVISRISKTLHESTKTFILDTEAVAWDKETKQILPFQVLSTRKKKDAVESDIVVQVCIMAFDLLYLNGESLVKKTLKERRALLHSSFIEIPNEFMFVNYKDGNSAETMQEYLDESIKGNCEGLMVKSLTVDASYEIAKRSHNWLKLKKDYLKGIGDTLDLVVIGGYHGKGKRTGNYGGFLLACYDEENEEFQSICKLGTGFSEEELETHTKFLKEHVIKEPRSYYRYDSSLEPDEWFDAVQIWEIKCADLSISPVHKAAQGIVDPEKGISLRFPRFLRIRDDKTKPEDCTSATQIAELYQNQEQVQNTTKNKNVKTEEDYY